MISPVLVLGIVFSLVVAVAVPVAALVVLKVKTGRGLLAALVGAACFFVYAMVLEQLLHAAVFSLFPAIRQMPAAYVLYGCLAAGLFEETGRLMGLSFLCKKDKSLAVGVGYGIGHGGIEAVLLVGVTYVANLLALFGVFGSVLQRELRAADPGLFFMAGVERLVAMSLHMALSLLVWMVVTRRASKLWYFGAIVLHALGNVPAALAQVGVLKSVALVEMLIAALTAAVCAVVWLVYKKGKAAQPQTA